MKQETCPRCGEYKEALFMIAPHVADLGWEYDRLSQDGGAALKAIDKILNDLNDSEEST
jgi:hypothetical protein